MTREPQLEQFSLAAPSAADVAWLSSVLNREGASFGTTAEQTVDNQLSLRWRAAESVS